MNSPSLNPSGGLIPFSFKDHTLRVVSDETGNPVFHAGDVCVILGFGNYRQALASHVDIEDVQKLDTLSKGGKHPANYVNESGLYALIFGSTKPEAKAFRRWVTKEVLPAIRQTGQFALSPNPLPQAGEAKASLGTPLKPVPVSFDKAPKLRITLTFEGGYVVSSHTCEDGEFVMDLDCFKAMLGMAGLTVVPKALIAYIDSAAKCLEVRHGS